MNTTPLYDWRDDADLIRRIYMGRKAESTLADALRQRVQTAFQTRHSISKRIARPLTIRALRAFVNSIRNNKDPRPDLLDRMIHDQALVYRLQTKIPDPFLDEVFKKKLMEKYRKTTERYILKYMKRATGEQLTLDQELVRNRSLDLFHEHIQQKNFKLTSTLSTYLLGIVDKLIKSSARPSAQSANPEPVIPLLTLRFLHQAHRLIIRHLYDNALPYCVPIIFDYYGLDKAKVDRIADIPALDTALTMEEFHRIFAVGKDEITEAISLESIIKKLGMSEKQASKRHLNCLDELVEAVADALFTDSSLKIPAESRRSIQKRVAEARKRRRTT